MDMQVLSSLLVGIGSIGTLVLAVAALWGLKQTRNQQRIISRQLDIQQSQLRPNVQIKSFNFNGNMLNISIENVSTVAAYWVGVLTRFYLIYPQYFDSQESHEQLSRTRVEQMMSEKKQLFVKYQLFAPSKQPKLTHDSHIVSPAEAVVFAGNDLPGAIILSRETRSIKVEPMFYVSTGSMLGIAGNGFNFTDLKAFLLQHDITWIAFSFELIFKDVTEDIIRSEWITKFAFNMSVSSSLADAASHSNPVFFLPLSASEIQAKSRFLPGDSYRAMKTPH